jgi:tetratricopeptide (TPR) repeat protein
MLQSQLILQWLSHKKNLFAITCIATAQAFFSPVEGKLTGKEALTLRRIAEFWKDGDYEIAKRQIHVFLDQFPKSPAKEHLCHMLGDLYFHEKKYQEAYTAYSNLTSEELLDQTIFSRLCCLAQLKDYSSVVKLTEQFFQKERGQEEALEVHYLAADAMVRLALLNSEPEKQREWANKAYLHYLEIVSSKYQQEFLFAFAEMQKLLKNYPSAINAYIELANQHPEKQEEMLFQAATLQVFVSKSAAAKTFQRIAALGGKTAQAAIFNQLSLLMEMGKYEDFLSAFEENQNLIPENKISLGQLYLGTSHFALNHFHEAKEPLIHYIKDKTYDRGHLKRALMCLMHCAKATSDLNSLTTSVQELREAFPKDSDLAKALLLRAQFMMDANEMDQAYADLQEILEHFPDFGDRKSILYTSAALLVQDGKWDDGRKMLHRFLTEFPHASQVPTAYRHLINCAFKLGDKQEAITYIRLLVDTQSETLSQIESQDFKFLLAKVLSETGQYLEALSVLDQYVTLFAEAENVYEAHLLSAHCHQNLQSQPELFILHAEKALKLKADLPNKDLLHLHLFNAYLKMGHADLQAAEHLTASLLEGKVAIKWENQLWLTDFYLSRAMSSHDDFIRAQTLMNKAFSTERHHVSMEGLILKYANLLEIQNLQGDRKELLLELVKRQEGEPDLPWKYQRLALFELAKSHEASHDLEEALKLYNRLIDTSTHAASYTGSAAMLYRARLQFTSMKKEAKHEEDSLFMQVLNDLKELQIRKNIQSEPIHLEAALDYAKWRSDILPTCEQDERYLFFLNRIKADFTSDEDPISQEYTAARRQFEEKDRLVQDYMAFVDAEMMRLAGNKDGAKASLQPLLSRNDLHPYLKERINNTYE